LFILTINNSKYKQDVKTLVGKMMVIKEYREIDLNQLSHTLGFLGINRLNIFCIDGVEGIHKTIINSSAEILFVELSVAEFVKFLNNPDTNFMDYNKNSLYILRDCSYMDVKLLFNSIGNHKVDIGRGGGQLSHVVSPLEFRLTSYLMAMFNFKYNDICYLNTFNLLNKKRYLPYIDKKQDC
jgi:hypothetical protein